MKPLNLKSLDELQTMLARIDSHRRTVNELDYTREDIVDEMNSRVDMTPNERHISDHTDRWGGRVPVNSRRSYFA